MPKLKESDKPWIDAYEPREWKVYTFDQRDVDNHPLRKRHPEFYNFIVCAAESHNAAALWPRWKDSTRAKFFYPDFEQIMAGMDRVWGMVKFHPEILHENWNDHPKGAMVIELHAPDRVEANGDTVVYHPQTIFMVEVP